MSQVERVYPNSFTPKGEVLVSPEGRGRYKKPLVVFGGIPGEEAEVKVTQVGQNQAYGHWVSSNDPSPHRVTPPCEKFGSCGGCPLMHLDSEGQARAHHAMMTDAFEEEQLDLEIKPIVPCPDGSADFRYVVKLGIGLSDRGNIKVGAWGRNNRHVIPISACTVASPVLRRVMASVAHHIIDLEIRPWDPERDTGILRSVVLRASRSTGEVLITLIAGKKHKLVRELGVRVGEALSEVVGVWSHTNQKPGNGIFDRDAFGSVGVSAVVGKETISEEINGIQYAIGPGDFFQTNPAVAELLYRRTIEALQLKEGVPVVDLYSGVGGFALQAARVTGWALGVEEIEGAVFRARDSARINGLTAEFLLGDVAEVLPDIKRRLKSACPVVTVNPSRKGLDSKVIEGILALNPRRVAYISCNPLALARDLVPFMKAGYSVAPLEPFDMFPNTAHVETLVVLTAPHADEATQRAPRRRVVRK